MAITSRKITTYAKNIVDLSDQPNKDGLTAAQLKAFFDGRTDEEVKTSINGIVDDLVATTDGASGADQIGATPLTGGTGNTVQEVLEEINDSTVHDTGDETVAGVKTFSSSPIVPTPTTDMQASTKKYVDDLDALNVHLAGVETITGVKTFSVSPIVPAPTTDTQASTKKYVDDTDGARKTYVDNLDALAVHLAGNETITGIKTFSASPVVPAPTTDTQAATKKYVDDADALKVDITDIVNDLTTGGADKALSAEQGVELAQQISQLDADKADKLKVALIENELNTCKSTLANVNINNEATQTATGYGVVSLPKNAANGQVSVSLKGNTVTDENGTKSTVSASRLKSVGKNLFEPPKNAETRVFEGEECWVVKSFNILDKGFKENTRYTVSGKGLYFAGFAGRWGIEYTDGSIAHSPYYSTALSSVALTSSIGKTVKKIFLNQGAMSTISTALVKNSIVLYEGIVATPYEPYKESSLYLPDVGVLKSLGEVSDEITATEHIKRIDDDGTALATPIITPIQSSGTLVSFPSGTVYVEKAIADAGIYDSGITVLNTDKPISTLESLSKIDFATGQLTPLDASTAVIAGDGLSFTHTGLSDGDIVFFTYLYDEESTEGEATVTYYDSRYVIEDSVNSKFYKWAITSANGVPSIGLVEV